MARTALQEDEERSVLTSHPNLPSFFPVCLDSKEVRSARGTRTLSSWAVAMRARWLALGSV